MKKVKEKNYFLPKDLSYFDNKKSLITIDDETATAYKVILSMGGVIFVIGLGLFFLDNSDFGIFFLFFSTVFFLARGLYHYLVYLKYKDIPLTLHHKNLKVGKTLRGYATISVPCEIENFKIILKNEYVYKIHTTRNNKPTTDGYRNLIWFYETKGYVKVEEPITYVYFKIPISNDASATKELKDGYKQHRREFVWTLILKDDRKYFSLNRKYRITIRE